MQTTINLIYKIRHGFGEFLNGLQRLFLDTLRVNQTYFMNNGSMKKVLQKPCLKVTGLWDSISFHSERFLKQDLHEHNKIYLRGNRNLSLFVL